jgi:hypothetical protein
VFFVITVVLGVVGSTTGMVLTPFVVVGRQATPVEGTEAAKGCGAACSMSAAVDRLVEGHNLDFGIVVPKAQ